MYFQWMLQCRIQIFCLVNRVLTQREPLNLEERLMIVRSLERSMPHAWKKNSRTSTPWQYLPRRSDSLSKRNVKMEIGGRVINKDPKMNNDIICANKCKTDDIFKIEDIFSWHYLLTLRCCNDLTMCSWLQLSFYIVYFEFCLCFKMIVVESMSTVLYC